MNLGLENSTFQHLGKQLSPRRGISFSFVGSLHCYDKLDVYAGNDTEGPHSNHISTICGQNLPQPLVVRGPMLLVFTSDHSEVRYGFQVDYTIQSKSKSHYHTCSYDKDFYRDSISIHNVKRMKPEQN